MSKTESQIHESALKVTGLLIKDGKPKETSWSPPEQVETFSLDAEGARVGDVNDRHYGMTRLIRGYQIGANRKGVEVLNDMQLSFATREDLTAIARILDVEAAIKEKTNQKVEHFMAGALGVNIVFEPTTMSNEEIKSYLGPGTKLIQGEDTSGSIMHISETNLPCHKPAEMMWEWLELEGRAGFDDMKEFVELFISQSLGLRGWVGMTYKPGELTVGDELAVQLGVDTRNQVPPDWRSEAATRFWPRPN